MRWSKRLRAKLSRLKWKAVGVAVTVGTFIVCNVPVGLCSTDDMGNIIQEWMPTIVQFAMLAMILGMLKKFGGRR